MAGFSARKSVCHGDSPIVRSRSADRTQTIQVSRLSRINFGSQRSLPPAWTVGFIGRTVQHGFTDRARVRTQRLHPRSRAAVQGPTRVSRRSRSVATNLPRSLDCERQRIRANSTDRRVVRPILALDAVAPVHSQLPSPYRAEPRLFFFAKSTLQDTVQLVIGGLRRIADPRLHRSSGLSRVVRGRRGARRPTEPCREPVRAVRS